MLFRSEPMTLPQCPTLRRTLRVAVVTETWPPEINGVALTIRHMVTGLQQRGHHVQLVRPRQGTADSTARGEQLEEMLVRGVAIPRYSSLRFGLPAKRALRRRWTQQRPDVVHIVTEGPLGWSARNAALDLGIACSSDFHTNFHSYKIGRAHV